MPRKRNERKWTTIDPNSLQHEVREAYEQFQRANDAQKAACKNFERTFTDAAGISSAQRIIFSFQADTFCVALEPYKRKRGRSKPGHFDKWKDDNIDGSDS